jgi:hypothetical protein
MVSKYARRQDGIITWEMARDRGLLAEAGLPDYGSSFFAPYLIWDQETPSALTDEMLGEAETAATEERRRIGRKTGRRSTILTSGLEWPPNVYRTTLLGG